MNQTAQQQQGPLQNNKTQQKQSPISLQVEKQASTESDNSQLYKSQNESDICEQIDMTQIKA